jgi:cytochrome c2
MMCGRVMMMGLALLAGASGCDRKPPPQQQQPVASVAEIERGRLALATYGCAACHSIKGMHAPQRTVGPPLERVVKNSYIAGVLPNNTDAMARWIMEPRRVSPGTAMPDLGVSADEARAMAAYLYSQ